MDNKWSRYYSEGEGPTKLDVQRTLYEVLADTADRFPDRIAIEHGKKHFKYSQLLSLVDTAAEAFRSIGIAKWDCIALAVHGLPATVITIYAASKIGARVSMFSTENAPDRFKKLCIDQKCKAVIMTPDQIHSVIDVLPETMLKSVIVVKYGDYFTLNDRIRSPIRKVLALDSSRVRQSELPSEVSLIYWLDLLRRDEISEHQPFEKISASDTVVYLNGGSVTGKVMTTELSSVALNEQASLDIFIITNDSERDVPVRSLSFIDRYFSCGLCLGIHSIIASGNTMLLYAGNLTRFPVDVFGFYKPDVVIGYPGLLMQMTESTIIRLTDVSFLDKIVSCGAVMNPGQCYELRRFFDRSRCDVSVERVYGIDETGSVYIYNPSSLENDRILGIPIPGVLVKIMDPDSETEMPAGQQGQICVCTPSAMSRYAGDEEIGKIAKRRFKDGRVWICTGDTGHEDDNGLIYFDGNTKRIVERNGMIIYPYVIEEEIVSITGVKEVCAVVVDEATSPRVVAVVVPEDEYLFDASRLDELKTLIEAECNLTLPAGMRPDEIEFRAYLPKENFGKNDHDALRIQIESRDTDEEIDLEAEEDPADDILIQ